MIGAILAGVAIASSLYSSYQAKEAADAAATKQKEANKKKSDLEREQADLFIEEANIKAGQNWVDTMSLTGTQIGAYTARGVDISSGSVLAVLNQTRQMGNQDYDAILRTAFQKAKFMKTEADLIEQGAYDNAAAAQANNQANLISGFASTGLAALTYFK